MYKERIINKKEMSKDLLSILYKGTSVGEYMVIENELIVSSKGYRVYCTVFRDSKDKYYKYATVINLDEEETHTEPIEVFPKTVERQPYTYYTNTIERPPKNEVEEARIKYQ